MILPFLQIVVPEVRRLSRAIAVHDPKKRDARWWRVTIEDVWDYGVRVSGDKRPDGIIRGELAAELLAADVEYPGPGAELVELLSKVGLVEVRRDWIRVKGVPERYGKAWDTQKRNSAAGQKGAKSRWNHAGANGADPAPAYGKTKTETEKKTEMKRDPDLRSGAKPSFAFAAKAHFDRQREARFEELGMPLEADESYEPAWVNTKVKAVLERLGGEEHPEIETRWSELVSVYLDREQTAKAQPPYPLRILASPKTWEPLVEQVLSGGAP